MSEAETPSLPRRRRLMPFVALGLGGLAVALGLLLVGAYVFGAVINRLGEPDQSLLFWYLPFAMIGVTFLIIGAGAIVLGIVSRKRDSADATPPSSAPPGARNRFCPYQRPIGSASRRWQAA